MYLQRFGLGKPMRIDLKKKTYLGRDHHLAHGKRVSKKHALIQITKEGHILLLDLGSEHGTYVENKKVDPLMGKIIKKDDHISFGRPWPRSGKYFGFQLRYEAPSEINKTKEVPIKEEATPVSDETSSDSSVVSSRVSPSVSSRKDASTVRLTSHRVNPVKMELSNLSMESASRIEPEKGLESSKSNESLKSSVAASESKSKERLKPSVAASESMSQGSLKSLGAASERKSEGNLKLSGATSESKFEGSLRSSVDDDDDCVVVSAFFPSRNKVSTLLIEEKIPGGYKDESIVKKIIKGERVRGNDISTPSLDVFEGQLNDLVSQKSRNERYHFSNSQNPFEGMKVTSTMKVTFVPSFRGRNRIESSSEEESEKKKRKMIPKGRRRSDIDISNESTESTSTDDNYELLNSKKRKVNHRPDFKKYNYVSDSDAETEPDVKSRPNEKISPIDRFRDRNSISYGFSPSMEFKFETSPRHSNYLRSHRPTYLQGSPRPTKTKTTTTTDSTAPNYDPRRLDKCLELVKSKMDAQSLSKTLPTSPLPLKTKGIPKNRVSPSKLHSASEKLKSALKSLSKNTNVPYKVPSVPSSQITNAMTKDVPRRPTTKVYRGQKSRLDSLISSCINKSAH